MRNAFSQAMFGKSAPKYGNRRAGSVVMRNDMQPPWRSPAAPYRAFDGVRAPRPPPPPPRRPALVTRSNAGARGPRNRSSNPSVAAAAAYSTGMSSTAPSVSRSGNDSCRIVHRELLGNISGSAGYAVGPSFQLNPGLPASFPWLSTQAQSWEQYRFNKLRFCYYTRTSSSTPGSVMFIPDYDAADSAPLSEQIASSYGEVVEDSPWKDLCCTLRPDRMHSMGPKKFVRSAPLAANLDIKTYDVGSLFVATTDGSAIPWGKIWVEYDVTLFVPQLQPSGSLLGESQHSLFSSSTTGNLFGGTQADIPKSAVLFTVGTNSIILAVEGRYFLSVAIDPATSATNLFVTSATGGGVFIGSYGLSAGSGIQQNFAPGTSSQPAMCNIIIGGPVGATFNLTSTIVGGGSAEVMLIALNKTQG